MKRKKEALIPIAEATNGVRSRAHPGAFIFQVRPPMRPGAPSRVRTDVSRVKAKSATNLHHRGGVIPGQG